MNEFNECRVTEAHVKNYDRKTDVLADGKATNMGATGSITFSAEYKKIVKNEEGVEAKSVKRLAKLTGTLKIHMPLTIARIVYGLSNDKLKKGVYALGEQVDTPNMLITAKVLDLFTDEIKYIALPKVSITSGFAKTIDNTSEEIVEVELAFDALRDENKKFYYEAIESELDTTDGLSKKWLEEFTPALALAASK